MYAIKNKLLLITITTIVTISNAKILPLLKLSAGDIVNINDFKESSTEIIGNMLDGYKAGEFTKTDLFASIRYTNVKKEKCSSLESLVPYSYPEIIIDETKADPQKLFNRTDRQMYNYFGIEQNYIDNKYWYGIIKLCRTVKIQNLNIQVMNANDSFIIEDHINYKLLLDTTAVLRFKGNHGTHFVSSIITGDCLLQVYVNKAEICEIHEECQKKRNLDDHFFESSLHKGRVIITSNNRDLENKINGDLNKSGKSLIHLSNDPTTYSSIFDFLNENSLIRIELHSLPELPESPSRRVKSSIIYPSLLSNLKPGDIINVEDLKKINASIMVDNMLADVYDEVLNRSTTFKYSNCFKDKENDTVKLELVTYKTYPHYPADSYYKFSIFDETIKRNHYGVDHKYLNNKYKCMKITICSEVERRKLIIPSIRVVNLEKKAINSSNIFNNENIVLRYKLNNETHYVARTEKGNCLFQALIFPNDKEIPEFVLRNSHPLHKGKIISATDDRVFENSADNFISNLKIFSPKTLMAVVNNPEVRVSFFHNFFK